MPNIGPTKRSADSNDYVELESKLSTAQSEINRLKAYNKKLLETLSLKDKQIQDLECKERITDPEIIVDIHDYIKVRDLAIKLREENRKASNNFNTTGESGSFKTPTSVIDAGLNWTKKSVEICNKLVIKLGFKK